MRTILFPILSHAMITILGFGLFGCEAGKSSEASSPNADSSTVKLGLSLATYIDQVPIGSNYNVICGAAPESRYFESNKSLSEMLLNRACTKVPTAGKSKFSIIHPKLAYATLRAVASDDPMDPTESEECQLSAANLGLHKYIIVNQIERKHISGDVLEVTFVEGAFPKACDKIKDPRGKFHLSMAELQGPGLMDLGGASSSVVVKETSTTRKFLTTNFATKFKDSEMDSSDVLNVVSCALPKGSKIYYKGDVKTVNRHKYVVLDGGEQNLSVECSLTQGYLFAEHIQ